MEAVLYQRNSYLRERDEEVYSAVLHAAGLGAFVMATVVLADRALQINAWAAAVAIVYGVSQSLLYLASTVFHIATYPPRRRRLRLLDHAGIFVMICGTYTPFLYVATDAPWNWLAIVGVWILGISGIWVNYRNHAPTSTLSHRRRKLLSLLMYLGMGWAALIFFVLPISPVARASFDLLLAGGIAYTIGVGFYVRDINPGFHVVWHVAVMVGSLLHLGAVWGYFIIP